MKMKAVPSTLAHTSSLNQPLQVHTSNSLHHHQRTQLLLLGDIWYVLRLTILCCNFQRFVNRCISQVYFILSSIKILFCLIFKFSPKTPPHWAEDQKSLLQMLCQTVEALKVSQPHLFFSLFFIYVFITGLQV